MTTTNPTPTALAFADHARELLVRGYTLRLTLADGGTMKAWCDEEGDIRTTPASWDDIAAGVVETVCDIDSEYLAHWLTGARIDEREEPAEGLRGVVLGDLAEHRSMDGATIKFDERDHLAMQWAHASRMNERDIMVGDWVRFPDGTMLRVSYCWPDKIQTTNAGSFHLHTDGWSTMSGGLFRGIDRDSFVALTTVKLARFWTFHHQWAGGHRGVGFRIPVRVWACTEDSPAY